MARNYNTFVRSPKDSLFPPLLGRGEFFIRWLVVAGAILVLAYVFVYLTQGMAEWLAEGWLGSFAHILHIAMIAIPAGALMVMAVIQPRLRDAGYNPVLAWLSLVPIFGVVVFLVALGAPSRRK